MSVETGQTAQAGLASGKTTRTEPWAGIVQACVSVTPMLSDVLSQFWGVPVKLVFFGVSQNTHYFWRMDDFHVSRLTLEKPSDHPGDASPPAMAELRLSESTCSTLLNRVLGAKPTGAPEFSFRQLSPLEATILNEFSRDLLGVLRKNLLKKPAKKANPTPLHLLWLVALENPEEDLHRVMNRLEAIQFLETLETGKIVLSLPANAIESMALPDALSEQGQAVPDQFFFHVQAPARIYLGSTKVPLVDLDHLEREDIIVLEDSHINSMALIEPESGEHLPFTAQMHNAQSITIPDTQEFDEMDSQMQGGSARQKLWDNLMIEVGAEFEPVKLPLKQLKQMSEGLVIEMGDLIHNQISLQVEGKTLARGELIIVGDKFGVRVSQVVNEEESVTDLPTPMAHRIAEQSSQPMAQPQAMPQQPMPQGEVQTAEEDLNLDNFLNEDFDETFAEEEGEEDW